VRGAQMLMGYYKRPDIETFDAEGWFDTGDLAYADDEGYIRINGRTKDVLIRGGENVPVVEIEALLYKHPSVAAAALVGYPDRAAGRTRLRLRRAAPGAELHARDAAGLHGRVQGGQAVLARARGDRRRPAAHAQRQGAEVQAARTGRRRLSAVPRPGKTLTVRSCIVR
jgi:acyl-CoA synthetase (AMP-forming)/AMP-acid ligase II